MSKERHEGNFSFENTPEKGGFPNWSYRCYACGYSRGGFLKQSYAEMEADTHAHYCPATEKDR